MPSPQDGTLGTLVPPTDADVALDADNADPGEVEKAQAAQRASSTGKYGTQPITPYKPPVPSQDDPVKKKSWIAIKLLDTDGQPVPGELYEITLPDNTVASGTTGADGGARVDGFDPGQCKVTFPKLDTTVVKPA